MTTNENMNADENIKTNQNLNAEQNTNADHNRDEELKKVIAALFHRTTVALKSEFPDFNVSGHVRYHNVLGPFFPFELKKENLHYSCGFMFNELIERHKNPENAKLWLSSFYIDMIDEGKNTPLPTEPANPEEANALIRDVILPHCLKTIREEFGENAVQVKFINHPKAGPVLEAGVPAIKEGHNVCAVPINLLLALHLLNRDCADTIINGLYKIREEAGIA